VVAVGFDFCFSLGFGGSVGFELRVSLPLESQPQPLTFCFSVLHFQMESCAFAQVGLDPYSPGSISCIAGVTGMNHHTRWQLYFEEFLWKFGLRTGVACSDQDMSSTLNLTLGPWHLSIQNQSHVTMFPFHNNWVWVGLVQRSPPYLSKKGINSHLICLPA
jgi:hypothetical protein